MCVCSEEWQNQKAWACHLDTHCVCACVCVRSRWRQKGGMWNLQYQWQMKLRSGKEEERVCPGRRCTFSGRWGPEGAFLLVVTDDINSLRYPCMALVSHGTLKFDIQAVLGCVKFFSHIRTNFFFYFFLIMTAFVCRARTNILDQSKLWDQLYCGGQTVVLIPVLCRTKTKIYGVFKLMKWFCAAVASAAGRSLGSIESQMELTMLERKKKNCKHFFSN